MKKRLTKRILSVMLCVLALQAALAEVTYDGMTFEVNNEVTKTATLTKGRSDLTNVFVPETVNIGGVAYTVNTIGENAFYQCEIPGALTLPPSVVYLDFCAFQQLTVSSLRIQGDLQRVDYGAFFGNKAQAIICYSTTYFTHDMGVLTNKEKTMIIAFPGRPTSEKWGSANLTIPDNYEYISPYAFAENPKLTGITIPASVKEIGISSFFQCPNLKSITIKGGNTVVADGAFKGCEQVTSLSLPVGLKTVGHSAFFDLVSLKTLTLPEGMESTGIMAFGSCEALTTINFPSTLKTISERSFMACNLLTQINLPESLDTIAYSAFYGDDLRALNLKNVKWVGGQAFSNNYNLSSINFGEQLDFLGNAAFYGCRSITGVTLPASLREMEGTTFYLCSGLNDLTIPSGVEIIGPGITVGTTSLNEIKIDPANTNFAVRDGWLYTSDFKQLVAIPGAVDGTLTIPDGVTVVRQQAARRLAITELVTPQGLKKLEFASFMQCAQLAKITLSATVDTIEENAFATCSAITEVTSLNRVPPVGGVFVDEVYTNATLYVPRGYKEAYQADENWGKFTTIEEIDVETPDLTRGDLNGDGMVDVSDVSLLIDVVLGKTVELADGAVCDLNGDGNTDVTDVSLLIDIVLGKEVD